MLVQLFKNTSGKKTIWPGSNTFVAIRKLYCLIEHMHSGVLALAKIPKDVDEKSRN